MDLTTATPVEIDTRLSELEAKVAELMFQHERINRNIDHIDNVEPGSYESMLPGYSPERRAELVQNLERLLAEIASTRNDIAPLNAEYDRRGGWNRYYLVTNTGGHVHKDMDCTTCFATTQYARLNEQAGMSHEDLVELAGEAACTTCFPWAPVNVLKRKTRLETPERKAAREEREAKKAAAAAKKAANSITTPEGEPLYEDKDSSSYMVCKTLRTAEIAATDALVDLAMEQRSSQDPEYTWRYEKRTTESIQAPIAAHAWCLLRSIAAKKGQTFEETFQVHEKKAQAKVRKMDREWAKDPRNPNRSK